jgi:hypothetical protein
MRSTSFMNVEGAIGSPPNSVGVAARYMPAFLSN